MKGKPLRRTKFAWWENNFEENAALSLPSGRKTCLLQRSQMVDRELLSIKRKTNKNVKIKEQHG